MKTPRVSVIIAAHNYAPFLPQTLDSVLAQTMPDWECIVVDDGSTDATPDVGRAYEQRDSRIRYVRQANGGPSAARNNGIRVSSGEYLQFLDADDLLDAAKLQRHASFLEQHSDTDIVYGPSTFFRTDEPERVLYSLHGKLSRPLMVPLSGAEEPLRVLQMTNMIPVLSALVRRSVFERTGYYNEAVRGPEDWDLWLRAAIAGCRFHYLASDTVAHIRIHRGSLSSSAERMVRALITAANTFHGTPTARFWHEPALPLIYEMSAGIGEVNEGRRFHGAGRILHAARHATSKLIALRWLTYALAAVTLPRRVFFWIATRPIPEQALELVRRFGRHSVWK